MTKAQILKQTGLTEQEFYKLYPTQQHYQMAMGGRLYADGGGLPPDEGTSYVQYDEAGNPITANQMYSNKNSLNLRDVTSSPTTTNWTQDNENAKLEDLQSLKRQKEALEYNLQNSQNEVSKSRIKDELNAVNDKINHWETYGVSKPKEGLYYESNDGMNYSELGMRNEGMHYSEKDVPESFDDMSFNSAFGAARKQGLKKFTWKGKSYGTNLKGESTKSSGKIPPPVVSEIKGAPRRMAFGGNIIQYPNGGDLEKYVQMYYNKYSFNEDPSLREDRKSKGIFGYDELRNELEQKYKLSGDESAKIVDKIRNPWININESKLEEQERDDTFGEGPETLDQVRNVNKEYNPGFFPMSNPRYKPVLYTSNDDGEDRLRYGGGGDIEKPRPVVHTGTANNKTWLRQGLDYLGNLGVQDFSNNIQDIFFNPNKGVKLDRTNPNVGTNIPTVKNYNSSNIKPLYTQQYADGGNLAGNMGMTGIQNDDVKANNKYFTDAEAGLAAFAENMPIVGSIVKAQNNRLSGAREQIDKKGGIGAGAGQAFSQAVNMGLGLIGGIGGKKNNSIDSPNTNIQDPGFVTPELMPDNTSVQVNDLQNAGPNVWGNAYGGRLNFAAGGALTEINTGGTHEQNPMGGVMVGKNASVEQGEALINKDGKPAFVLTDRIKLDSTTAEEFGLPKKYIGKTFSDIGKAENRVSDLRPNDPLTKDLLKSRNEKLEAAQEAQKARMAEKHMAKAQELAPEMFQQAQPQGMPQEQMAMQDPAMEQMMAMQGQGMPQDMPQQPMMASGGSLNFKSSGAYNKWLGYVHANKLAENTPGHQKVSIGGEPHRVQHGYGGVMQYPLGGPFDFSKAIKSAEMLYNMRPENNMSDQEVILPDDYRDPYLPVQGNLKEYPNTIVTLDTNISPNIPDIKRNVYGKIRGFEGVPPNINTPEKQELKDILLSDTKIPKDRTGLKAAILGTQAAMEAARLASTEKPVDFRNVQYTQVNPYISQAIMQANKNNDIANYRDVLRNAGASQAQYIGNATQTFPAMSADYASKIAMLRYQADQANNQIANTEEQTNQAIGAQNIERRAQAEANLSNQLGNIGAGLVQNTLPIITEKEKRDMQLATMGLMNTPQYKYVMDEKTGRLKKFFHPTDPGLQNTTANIQTDAEGNKYIFNTTTETWNKIGAYGGKIAKKKFGGSMKNC